VTQQQGEKNRLWWAQLGYDSLAAWRAYTFRAGTRCQRPGTATTTGAPVSVVRIVSTQTAEHRGRRVSEGQIWGRAASSARKYLVLGPHHSVPQLLAGQRGVRTAGLVPAARGTLGFRGMKAAPVGQQHCLCGRSATRDIDSASGLTHATGRDAQRPPITGTSAANAEVGQARRQSDRRPRRSGRRPAIRIGYGYEERSRASSGIEFRDDQDAATRMQNVLDAEDHGCFRKQFSSFRSRRDLEA